MTLGRNGFKIYPFIVKDFSVVDFGINGGVLSVILPPHAVKSRST